MIMMSTLQFAFNIQIEQNRIRFMSIQFTCTIYRKLNQICATYIIAMQGHDVSISFQSHLLLFKKHDEKFNQKTE